MAEEDEELMVQHLHEGRLVKAYDVDDNEWKRANVIDFCKFELDKKPIKVRIAAKKKADRKEVWLPVDAVRLVNKIKIDWEGLDEKLPVRQDPESRQIRDQVFRRLDENGKGTLNLKEITANMPDFVRHEVGHDIEDLKGCIKRAYEASRRIYSPKKKGKKAADKVIDRTEFHAFVQAFRDILQVAELFEQLDVGCEDDQMLSHRECLKGMVHFMAWNVDEAKLAQLFQGEKMWTPKVKFADFADFLIENRWSQLSLKLDDDENEEVLAAKVAHELRDEQCVDRKGDSYHVAKGKIMKIFKEWDADGDGEISQEELTNVLTALDPKITAEAAAKMFELSDSDNNGVVDIEEFVKWMLM
eukprot:TRINITY_DN1345_c0_g1_i1.p1 TRINITY_DN1345_c0_g1~~TRINITY_DN1345_c0_g1_i1.p1  ORF type:complete len:358 (+),score=119.14 TRINITY_DN1345_c0_g1_i1:86-1159(+)